MKNGLLALLLLLAAAPAEAQLFKKKKKAVAPPTAQQMAAAAEDMPGMQRLSLEDLLDIMDHRDDSAHARTLLVKAGFDRKAKAERNQVVYMGDTAVGVTKYSEMVFLQSDSTEIQVLQWCTRHADNYEGIRRALRSDRRFTGQPILTEEGEVSESFYFRDYHFLIESVNKKTKWVISVWLRGARL